VNCRWTHEALMKRPGWRRNVKKAGIPSRPLRQVLDKGFCRIAFFGRGGGPWLLHIEQVHVVVTLNDIYIPRRSRVETICNFVGDI
jgi:hypothetical protein